MTHAGLSCLFLALLFSIPACAGENKTPPRTMQIQASMLISGNIVVAPDGRVAEYHLDKASKIPPAAKTAMAKSVPTWRFEPVLVDGKAVRAKAAMRVRLIAKHVGKDRYSIGIESAWFPDPEADNSTTRLHMKKLMRPRYPPEAIKQNVQGTVYVVIRANREGEVDKFAVRQVDLRRSGSGKEMREWRQLLIEASEKVVRKWTFTPPTTGPKAGQDHWLAIVPVTYEFNDPGAWRPHQHHQPPNEHFGEWIAYVPGPKHFIPWADETEKYLIANADALPDSGVFSTGQSAAPADAPVRLRARIHPAPRRAPHLRGAMIRLR